jgi:hypothetical protein
MANLPASGYLSNAARTEAEMQTAFESLRDVVAELGSTAPTTRTIASGNLPVPNASLVLVRSEGYSTGADDVLDTITTTGIDQGRIVILRNSNTASTEAASSEKITISHGTGANAIELTDDASFILCADRLIALVYNGTRWLELWRSYGRKNAQDATAERAYLGLGTAAVEAIATAVGAGTSGKLLKVGAATSLAENAILALDANGNIKAGSADGGNAATLDSLDSTDFVRSTATAAQAMAANLTMTTAGTTRLNLNTTGSSKAPGIAMWDNSQPRGEVYYSQANGQLVMATYDASTVRTPTIRLNPANDRLEFSTGSGGAYQSLRPGSGNGLDADTVDGVEYATIQNLIRGQGLTWFLPSDVNNTSTEKVRQLLPTTFDIFSGLFCEVTFRFLMQGTSAPTVSDAFLYLDSGISNSGPPTTNPLVLDLNNAEASATRTGAGSGNWIGMVRRFPMQIRSNLDTVLITHSPMSVANSTLLANGNSLTIPSGVSPLWNGFRTSVTIKSLE